MRIEETVPAELIVQWQGFCLELDLVAARDRRPDVDRRGGVQIRVPELEDDFRITHREPVFVSGAPPQYERIVVKSEVRGIEEKNFSDPRLQLRHMPRRKSDLALLRRLPYDRAILVKILDTSETIRLQDKLALEIVHPIERTPVSIFAVLEADSSAGPSVVGCHRLPSGLLPIFIPNRSTLGARRPVGIVKT
jgi:hypothetical protein